MCKSLLILVKAPLECKEGEKRRKHAKKRRQKTPQRIAGKLDRRPPASPSKKRGQKAPKCTMGNLDEAYKWPFFENWRVGLQQKPWSQPKAPAPRISSIVHFGDFWPPCRQALPSRSAQAGFEGPAWAKERSKAAKNGSATRPEVLAADLAARSSRPRASANACAHHASPACSAWSG